MSYFTLIQTKLITSYKISDEEQEKLNKFLLILEESGVGEIIQEETKRDYSKGGRNSYNPYKLFAAIVYGFSKHSGSLRKIEESMTYDLRFIYLMEEKIPTYVTISKFLNNVVVKRQEEIYSKIVKTILKKFDISNEDIFLDGTKLEANANKYKFVYKPKTYKKNLFIKIKELVEKYEKIGESKETFTSKEVGKYLNTIGEKIKEDGIEIDKIQRGKGHKAIPIVQDYKKMESYLIRLLTYEEEEEICGPERNSYYKTDNDATAMCLKEDYYSGLGSNMHAAYNLQIMVSKGIIMDYLVSQERNDTRTLQPAIESYYAKYGEYPKRICADSGYGSLNNYEYINERGIENYIKMSDWARIMSGKYAEKYTFDEEERLVCLNGKIGEEIRGKAHPHGKAKIYKITGCTRCAYKGFCQGMLKQKGKERYFEANIDLYKYKKQALENLLSPKGIEMRINRSSQVEGAFGVIKQDMDYERARRRGLENVKLEVMLVCLGYNIRKLFTLIEGKAKIDYWKAPANLQAEKLPNINPKMLLNKKKYVGENEKLRAANR